MFSGKTVVVTGASSGIGRATAEAFADAGAQVVLAARREEQLQEIINSHPASAGRLLAVPADVTVEQDVERLAAATVARFGRVDILVNNAGIGMRSPVVACLEGDIRRLMEVNLFGLLRCTRAFLPSLRKAARGGSRAQIVNVGSVLSVVATSGSGIYCASKFAVRALSEAWRIELRDAGIEVILVLPGYTDTPFFDAMVRYGGPARVTSVQGQAPEKVARAILRACARHQREVALTFPGWFGVWLKRHAPALLEWGLRQTRHSP